MNEEIIEIIEEDKEELTIIEDGLTIGTNNRNRWLWRVRK